MSDHQKISDAIRAFLAAGEFKWNNELPDLAGNYATLCREANERLRKCSDFLRRGLRSEAVHLAECQPNLMALTGALNFPEAGQWARLCAANSLPVGPTLVVEGLADLSQAGAVERTLSPLLAQHRVASLGKAPLHERVTVLLELARRDAQNPCWREEIQLLESSRFDELREAAAMAIAAGDAGALAAIQSELASQGWATPIPPDLREQLRAALAQHSALQSADTARALAEEMLGAMNSGDVSRCQQLRRRWEAVSSTLDAATLADIRDEIQPVLQWLDPAPANPSPAAPAPDMEAAPPSLAPADESKPRQEPRQTGGRFRKILVGAAVLLALAVLAAGVMLRFFPERAALIKEMLARLH